jgi:hypothetical protein
MSQRLIRLSVYGRGAETFALFLKLAIPAFIIVYSVQYNTGIRVVSHRAGLFIFGVAFLRSLVRPSPGDGDVRPVTAVQHL